MSAKSKQKGAAFERDICRRLSLWVTAGERRDCFWRSAMSGGRATLGLGRGEVLARQAGDVSAIGPEGHPLTDRYYIELRFYRDLAIARSLLERRGTLAKFWEEVVGQAARYGRAPMLVAKQNLYPELILTAPGSAPDFGPPTLVAGGRFDLHLLADVLARPFRPPGGAPRRRSTRRKT